MNTRAYSMAVRGEQAAATRQRILDAARLLFDERAGDFTLEAVAATAGTSVRTVLRAYGSKDELVLACIGSIRESVPPRDELPRSPEDAVARIVADYEAIGDRVVAMLAEEHRVPGLDAVVAEGRRRHQEWVDAVFADGLRRLPAGARRPARAALLAATDVYAWKVLRRDLALDPAATGEVMTLLVRGALSDERRGN
jgi:AcrR family transcriptional regulator